MKKSVLLAESCMYWDNFKTGKSECIVGLPAPDKMNQFVPQDPASLGLYQTYIAMGKSPADSLELVLKANLGIPSGK